MQNNFAMAISGFGGNEVFQEISNFPLDWQLADGEIIVENKFIGINPLDYKTRSGLGWAAKNIADKFPALLGFEFAGIVLQSSAQNINIGTKVCGQKAGCFASFIKTTAANVAIVPDEVELSSACVLPIAALTASQIMQKIDFSPNQKIIVSAPFGGVGHFLLQMLNAKKSDIALEITAISAEKNRPLALERGVDKFIAYDGKITDTELTNIQADLFIDIYGSDDLHFYSAIKNNAEILTVPTIAVEKTKNTIEKLKCNIKVAGILVKENIADLEHLLEMIKNRKLTAEIAKIYPLKNAREALAELENGHCHGKIILSVE
ncbi:MAG: NADP-dependent oxidoreductase [Cardiobacteriaceae bacterium]|nr:NADP-dependent oxidoreductase [Cardiobacteriaceae bacterium]